MRYKDRCSSSRSAPSMLLPGIVIGYALASRVSPHVDRRYSRHAVPAISAASAPALTIKVLRRHDAVLTS